MMLSMTFAVGDIRRRTPWDGSAYNFVRLKSRVAYDDLERGERVHLSPLWVVEDLKTGQVSRVEELLLSIGRYSEMEALSAVLTLNTGDDDQKPTGADAGGQQ